MASKFASLTASLAAKRKAKKGGDGAEMSDKEKERMAALSGPGARSSTTGLALPTRRDASPSKTRPPPEDSAMSRLRKTQEDLEKKRALKKGEDAADTPKQGDKSPREEGETKEDDDYFDKPDEVPSFFSTGFRKSKTSVTVEGEGGEAGGEELPARPKLKPTKSLDKLQRMQLEMNKKRTMRRRKSIDPNEEITIGNNDTFTKGPKKAPGVGFQDSDDEDEEKEDKEESNEEEPKDMNK